MNGFWQAIEQLADLGFVGATRIRIIRRLVEATEPLSPVAVCRSFTEEVGDGPTMTIGAVAHHFRKLRDDGVIELVDERRVRGAVESRYRLTAKYRRKINKIVGGIS